MSDLETEAPSRSEKEKYRLTTKDTKKLRVYLRRTAEPRISWGFPIPCSRFPIGMIPESGILRDSIVQPLYPQSFSEAQQCAHLWFPSIPDSRVLLPPRCGKVGEGVRRSCRLPAGPIFNSQPGTGNSETLPDPPSAPSGHLPPQGGKGTRRSFLPTADCLLPTTLYSWPAILVLIALVGLTTE